jgi:hypothetical protein
MLYYKNRIEVVKKEGAMLMLSEVDRVLLRMNESRKHLDWRLCGSALSNLSKTSGMHIKAFINIYLSLFVFLTVYPCFAFKKYTGTSEFPFRLLVTPYKILRHTF